MLWAKNNRIFLLSLLLSNDERISPSFRVGYFVFSFYFRNKNYVDIVTISKVKNKSKRSSINGGLIFLSLLSSLFLFNACSQEKRELPILGNKEEVNGQMVYHEIPDFSFTDQDSIEVTNKTFEGKAYIADHFFISCPTICPKLSKSMLRIHDKFKNEKNLLLLSHTIDIKYDTIPRLKKYATDLDVSSNKWHFVTGDKQEIYDIAEDYFNVAMEDSDAEGGYNHSGRLVLVDKNRRIRAFCDGTDPESVDGFMEDIEVLLAEMEN